LEAYVSRGIKWDESEVLSKEHKATFLEREMTLLQAYFTPCIHQSYNSHSYHMPGFEASCLRPQVP
jgi:hypothetical protein